MKNLFVLFLLSFFTLCSHAQFAPQAGTAGTTAIHQDSSVFKAWATSCVLERGWQNIANTSLGKAVVGDETYVPGKAGNGVVSLGDGGMATIQFLHPIINGEGPDFAIFENGFIDQTLAPGTAFLELAFVEVSSDGEHFFRFPSTCLTDTAQQIQPFEGTVASNINNLAGKYIGGYGTPFDLEELNNTAGLDINHITHVRVIDVVGSINPTYATHDAFGHRINDPWPTPFASSGFDLDGVGVIHHDITQSIFEVHSTQTFNAYPNPAAINQSVMMDVLSSPTQLEVYDLAGKRISNYTVQTTDTGIEIYFAEAGIFQVVAFTADGILSKRLWIRE